MMPAAPIRRALALTIAAAGLLLGTAAGAQPPAKPRPLENIRTLKGWTGDEVRAEMRLISEALGVKCDYCHVQGNFAGDEKRAKHTARRMLELTMALNADYFAAAPPAAGTAKLGRVTCYTCHQGTAIPKQGAGPGALVW